jgi:glycosyltransferase involved in cell wall biosynthesis
MRCPSLVELPPPPAGRTGWPWTVESPQLPPLRSDGLPWPKITIVTPSFNQGGFIEETIRSVLLQGYPNLEYIIMDGGSSDETAAVVAPYRDYIASWRSAPDKGQVDAINRGLAKASGEIFQFINSDDFLASGALARVGASPAAADVIAGGVMQFGADEDRLYANSRLTVRDLLLHHGLTQASDFHQPGVFLRTAHLRELGPFDDSYRYVFDYKMMVRYLDRFPWVHRLRETLAWFRLHPTTKSVNEGKKFGSEFDRARSELVQAGLSARHARLCGRVIRGLEWPARVERMRERATSPWTFLISLTLAAASDPAVSLNRYTLGAMRRTVLPW